MTLATPQTFDPAEFLASAGLGRRLVQLKPKRTFFRQGDLCDSVFYLQKGRAKLTVISTAGKEATITLLSAGDFVGEECVGGCPGVRMATASAITGCIALKIERSEMMRVLHDEHAFSDMFLAFMVKRTMRVQADLVDQLFNSSEKRLARILLLMAEFGQPGEVESMIPPITQTTLADMIGTTRSRVSFFMNRFRKMGFIEYNGRIHVNKSLLNVILHDQLPDRGAYSGTDVPAGIAADAFYPKGAGVDALLKLVDAEATPRLHTLDSCTPDAPAWVSSTMRNPSGDVYVLLCCPECLRCSKQMVQADGAMPVGTRCESCGIAFHYALVQLEPSAAIQLQIQQAGRMATEEIAKLSAMAIF